ncbi:Bug family tripartite tricarboxylate transporter substrate binding protein [Bordetella genomosp. 13]|uniref:Bug family tripartite tricarboxylate transporter substrate binding protein n=1 Tax=Bordetella genomosp. 13 TaxID=463040 RepID=UPI0011AACEAF|nr:tripartite tricarboxylate transporter substrate binding protein [Bordetella genomosp. 13]
MKLDTLAIAVALSLGAHAASHAETYPDKPVKMLVGFAAGGSTDLVTRVLTQHMSEALGQSIVVENRLGASGTVATDVLAKSTPDGYTLGACSTSAFTILPYLMKSVRYDPIKDFQPVAQVGLAPYILVASPQLKVKSVQDVVDLARTKKGGLTYASGGVGSASQMAGELFSASAGVKMVHVPYKGLAQAIADVIEGRVDIAFDQEASAGENIRAQRLHAVAIANDKRSPTLPDVPTFSESGMPLSAAQWIGVCGPAGMPRDRVAKLYDSVRDAVGDGKVAARFQQLGVQPALLDPAAFGKAIDADRAKWKKLIDDAGITLE